MIEGDEQTILRARRAAFQHGHRTKKKFRSETYDNGASIRIWRVDGE